MKRGRTSERRIVEDRELREVGEEGIIELIRVERMLGGMACREEARRRDKREDGLIVVWNGVPGGLHLRIGEEAGELFNDW